ncbi:hypothetical protein AGMMS50239_15560 [Bacteroidia bacterium]|nr:hypothetical protein AGMMS50239_15560 [Bacteroidia bacterium]
MNTNHLFKYLSGCIVGILFLASFQACEDTSNDWGVDMSHDRLFKPLSFRTVLIRSTSVDIAYSKIIEANRYIFEFCENAVFDENAIAKTVEILADTLTEYASSNTLARIEYLTIFENLNGSTNYSVRMKGMDKNGRASNYVEVSFKTTQEQLFTTMTVSYDWAEFYWPENSEVSDLDVIEEGIGSILTDTKLTNTEIATGTKRVDGMKLGTRYRAEIYQNGRIRGVFLFKTAGMAGSQAYKLTPGEDIAQVLTNLVSSGYPNITMEFTPGETYDIGRLKIPAGVNSLVFSAPEADEKPALNLQQVTLTSAMDLFAFENVDITGDIGQNFLDASLAIEEVSFTGCKLSTMRGIVYIRNNSMQVKNITIDNCIIYNVAGYGIFNIAGSNVTLGDVIMKNTTLIDMQQLLDMRTKANSFIIGNCTFYNKDVNISCYLRFDNNAGLPTEFKIENIIMSGSNKDVSGLMATYSNYTGLTLNFGGSYMTGEMFAKVGSRKFTDITEYKGTAYDLFVDPDGVSGKRNFSIKPGAGFSGQNIAGDPRWFQ